MKNYTNQLLENLRKVQWCFIDNIWAADLVDMQLIRKSIKELTFFYV